jgi:hypothetical protein
VVFTLPKNQWSKIPSFSNSNLKAWTPNLLPAHALYIASPELRKDT